MNKATEARPGEGICLKSHGQQGRELRIKGDLQMQELLICCDTRML